MNLLFFIVLVLNFMAVFERAICNTKFDSKKSLANHSRGRCSKKRPEATLALVEKQRQDRETQQAIKMQRLEDEAAMEQEHATMHQSMEDLADLPVNITLNCISWLAQELLAASKFSNTTASPRVPPVRSSCKVSPSTKKIPR